MLRTFCSVYSFLNVAYRWLSIGVRSGGILMSTFFTQFYSYIRSVLDRIVILSTFKNYRSSFVDHLVPALPKSLLPGKTLRAAWFQSLCEDLAPPRKHRTSSHTPSGSRAPRSCDDSNISIRAFCSWMISRCLRCPFSCACAMTLTSLIWIDANAFTVRSLRGISSK